jgi:hypothetical protein
MLAVAGLLPALLSAQGKKGLGASAAGFSMRLRANKEAQPPVDFVDYGHGLGLGGVETSLPPYPARDLAKMLEFVSAHPPKKPLPRTSGLSPKQQLDLEDENNLKSIIYAHQHLEL